VTELRKRKIDRLEKELRAHWKRIYTSAEMAQFWGGSKHPGPFVYFNRDATRDTIVHFADGIGDANLLYRDEEYASKTRYERLVAPPAFVFSICSLLQSPSLSGDVHGWESGYELEWFRPLYLGDSFDWRVAFPSDLHMKRSRMGGKALMVYADGEVANQNKETVGIIREWALHVDMDEALGVSRGKDLRPYQYSDEELSEIYDAQDREIPCGQEPRYWEDVHVGQEIEPIVRGPLNMMDVIVWLAGCGSPISKPDNLWRRIDLYGRTVFDPETRSQLNIELCHTDDKVAKMVGLPAAYDFGTQRVSWLSVMVTNWMSDEGFLWKLRGELRKFNLIGDTQWFKGKIVKKYRVDGMCCVDIDCWAENQRKEITMPGTATVILPSREYGPAEYPEPRSIG
jgi:acyl dehydratase